jgi:Protein of unknown function (DUF1552)
MSHRFRPTNIQMNSSPFAKHLTPSRRSFLKAIGAGLAAFPLIDMLADSVAQAAGEELPLKFMGIYHPHGLAAEHWVMRSTDTETDFDINFEHSSLQPFNDATTYGKSFKDKILVLEGIELLSSANGHDTAGTILTGSRINGTKPQNVSLDQFLAVEKGLGKTTKLASLALAVGVDDTASGFTLSYGQGGAPLPKIIDPAKAFDLLFSGFVIGNDPDAEAKAARQRAMGKSIIDFVQGDVARLRARVAPREQQKLEQHLTSIRELEKQFQDPSEGPVCSPPNKPQAFPALKMYNGGEPYFDGITDVMVDLIAAAVSCDIVRFVTLYMNDLAYDGNPLGLPKDNHGGIAHTYNGSSVGQDGHPVDNPDPATWIPLAKFNKYSYSKVARLMQRLDAAGMLDSSLIYASSDMGNPALHSTRNVPTLLAGGANGKFRMGRRLKMQADCPTNLPWCAPDQPEFRAAPNNKLLVSIAQAFGQEVETFGTQPDPKLTTGAMSELF